MSLCGCGVCRYVSGHVDSYSSWDSIPLPVEGGGGGGGGGVGGERERRYCIVQNHSLSFTL